MSNKFLNYIYLNVDEKDARIFDAFSILESILHEYEAELDRFKPSEPAIIDVPTLENVPSNFENQYHSLRKFLEKLYNRNATDRYVTKFYKQSSGRPTISFEIFNANRLNHPYDKPPTDEEFEDFDDYSYDVVYKEYQDAQKEALRKIFKQIGVENLEIGKMIKGDVWTYGTYQIFAKEINDKQTIETKLDRFKPAIDSIDGIDVFRVNYGTLGHTVIKLIPTPFNLEKQPEKPPNFSYSVETEFKGSGIKAQRWKQVFSADKKIKNQEIEDTVFMFTGEIARSVFSGASVNQKTKNGKVNVIYNTDSAVKSNLNNVYEGRNEAHLYGQSLEGKEFISPVRDYTEYKSKYSFIDTQGREGIIEPTVFIKPDIYIPSLRQEDRGLGIGIFDGKAFYVFATKGKYKGSSAYTMLQSIQNLKDKKRYFRPLLYFMIGLMGYNEIKFPKYGAGALDGINKAVQILAYLNQNNKIEFYPSAFEYMRSYKRLFQKKGRVTVKFKDKWEDKEISIDAISGLMDVGLILNYNFDFISKSVVEHAGESSYTLDKIAFKFYTNKDLSNSVSPDFIMANKRFKYALGSYYSDGNILIRTFQKVEENDLEGTGLDYSINVEQDDTLENAQSSIKRLNENGMKIDNIPMYVLYSSDSAYLGSPNPTAIKSYAKGKDEDFLVVADTFLNPLIEGNAPDINQMEKLFKEQSFNCDFKIEVDDLYGGLYLFKKCLDILNKHRKIQNENYFSELSKIRLSIDYERSEELSEKMLSVEATIEHTFDVDEIGLLDLRMVPQEVKQFLKLDGSGKFKYTIFKESIYSWDFKIFNWKGPINKLYKFDYLWPFISNAHQLRLNKMKCTVSENRLKPDIFTIEEKFSRLGEDYLPMAQLLLMPLRER